MQKAQASTVVVILQRAVPVMLAIAVVTFALFGLQGAAVAAESGLTLHVRLLYGQNTHHIIEAIFKAFARALAEAVAIDARVKGVMSSKGKL